MTERVADDGVAAVRVVSSGPLDRRTPGDRPADGPVDVDHLSHQADRGAGTGPRRQRMALGGFIGQVHRPAVQLELGVPEPAVVHDRRLPALGGAKSAHVPVDGPPAVGDDEIGDDAGDRGRG